MNESNSVPKMMKCTNPDHTHFHPNGTLGASCERKIETKDGVLTCQGTIVQTKGQLFRDKHGITPTFKRNMQRKGLNPNDPASLDAYRALRKPARAERAATKKKKHDAAKAGRKSKQSLVKSK